MKSLNAVIIRFLQFTFLLTSIAGALALAFYLFLALFAPVQPGDVVTLNVRQAAPAATPHQTLRTIEEQVLTGQPSQYVRRASTGSLVHREPNPATRLLLRLVSSQPQPVPYVLAALLFSVLVFRILRDIRPGAPFTPTNVRRLRWLGGLLIACDVYHWTATWWIGHYLATVAPASAAGLTPVTQFGTSLVSNWLIGLLLLIIATGYQRGVELAEDAEFTV
ncbi:DUF2975 domain-containing protein [Hymenobacter negativus]|uniref:DUF2975 domain-containing protein n=1 Tax=Hymenobacter negativus TaxID=2795026 RepID=A0ABS3Q9B4_9BACT|nr:DUF2975 domain-containing protein [Hymenobacter negativus]MBO2007835.1 DUF2975 domain-containing protein [Hymenobacter negativus]